MNNQIRPLTAYKKTNKELYSLVWNLTNSNSLKGKENDFYFYYCNFNLDKRGKDSFFYNSEGMCTNKGTVSEIGRILLTGWYYDIEEFTKEIGIYIYNAFKKIESENNNFNDLEFQKAAKHIRNNILYYYQNKDKLKLYIIQSFFKDKIQDLLIEKPKELKEHNNLIELISEIRKNQSKKGTNFWINSAENNESYYYYLLEILENYNIDHLNFNEWLENEKIKDNDYYNKFNKIENDYNELLFKNIKQIKLT